MRTLVIVDYDPAWPARYETIRETVRSALSDIATSIEHVGSTSVPGLAAKPVIDVDVVVPEGRVPDAISRLGQLGYEHRGTLGILGREAFTAPDGQPPHHLYVCPAGNAALANHLAVRDYLRAHPARAADYGALKRRLARRYPADRARYNVARTEFILSVLRDAGVDEAILAEVVRANAGPGARPDSEGGVVSTSESSENVDPE